MSAYKLFHRRFDEITITVAFNPEWHNDSGYFNALVHEPVDFSVGTVFKSLTDEANPRKIICVVTPVGNAVFFENAHRSMEVISKNLPWTMIGLFPSDGALAEDTLAMAIGGHQGANNIGLALAALIKDVRA